MKGQPGQPACIVNLFLSGPKFAALVLAVIQASAHVFDHFSSDKTVYQVTTKGLTQEMERFCPV